MTKSRELKLIRLAAAGDADAATTLIRTHQSSVFAYIRRMSGRDDAAEDVAQEAFSRVLIHLDRFDPKYRFSTWLFTIARRIYLNMVEKKKPVCDTERLSTTVWAGRDVGQDIEDHERQDNERELLQRALLCVSREQREVLILFHQHDWPIWMIADQMGIPEGTVKSHLFRGRSRLRDEYVKLETRAGEHALQNPTGATARQKSGPAALADIVGVADTKKEVWT